MKNVLLLVFLFTGLNQAIADSYKHCQTLNGELEFILPLGNNHLFLAPHSLISSQRQIASLKSKEQSDVTNWETVHYKSLKNQNLWSQQNVSFKSDFDQYLEVSLNDGKTHTYSLKCTKI